jgi:hypothetical protein
MSQARMISTVAGSGGIGTYIVDLYIEKELERGKN